MAREKLSKGSKDYPKPVGSGQSCERRIVDALKGSLGEKTETLKKKIGSAIGTIVDDFEERREARLYRREKKNEREERRKEIRDVIDNEYLFLGLMDIVLRCFADRKYRPKSGYTCLWSGRNGSIKRRYGSIKLGSGYDPTSRDLYLVRESGEYLGSEKYSLSSDGDEYYIDGLVPKVRKSIKICSLRHILNLMLKQKIDKSSGFSKEEILGFFERLKNDSPLSLPEKIHYMTCFSVKLNGVKLTQ